MSVVGIIVNLDLFISESIADRAIDPKIKCIFRSDASYKIAFSAISPFSRFVVISGDRGQDVFDQTRTCHFSIGVGRVRSGNMFAEALIIMRRCRAAQKKSSRMNNACEIRDFLSTGLFEGGDCAQTMMRVFANISSWCSSRECVNRFVLHIFFTEVNVLISRHNSRQWKGCYLGLLTHLFIEFVAIYVSFDDISLVGVVFILIYCKINENLMHDSNLEQ